MKRKIVENVNNDKDARRREKERRIEIELEKTRYWEGVNVCNHKRYKNMERGKRE